MFCTRYCQGPLMQQRVNTLRVAAIVTVPLDWDGIIGCDGRAGLQAAMASCSTVAGANRQTWCALLIQTGNTRHKLHACTENTLPTKLECMGTPGSTRYIMSQALFHLHSMLTHTWGETAARAPRLPRSAVPLRQRHQVLQLARVLIYGDGV